MAGANGMLNEERRRSIVEMLDRDGRVLVTDLAKYFRTSQITIRKDLEVLDSQGRIHRTHGGALPVQTEALLDPTLREKEKLHRKEKMRIAAAAAGMVEEGQCVLLDSGTTTTAIARALKDIGKLTVITNAVNIAAELSGTNIEVILTGGMLRKNSFSLVGPVAEQALRQLSADILFLAWTGSTPRRDCLPRTFWKRKSIASWQRFLGPPLPFSIPASLAGVACATSCQPPT